jgi:hypothetical protein
MGIQKIHTSKSSWSIVVRLALITPASSAVVKDKYFTQTPPSNSLTVPKAFEWTKLVHRPLYFPLNSLKINLESVSYYSHINSSNERIFLPD